jgi:hypothetical protein
MSGDVRMLELGRGLGLAQESLTAEGEAEILV